MYCGRLFRTKSKNSTQDASVESGCLINRFEGSRNREGTRSRSAGAPGEAAVWGGPLGAGGRWATWHGELWTAAQREAGAVPDACVSP